MTRNDDLVLCPDLKHLLGAIAGCAVFVALSFGLLDREPFVALLGMGFFGLGGLVALIALLPGSCSLRLSRSGFTVRKFFCPTHYHWADVSPFSVCMYGFERVAFNFTGVYKVGGWGRLSQDTTGYAMNLPCNFGGLTAEELAALMNDWRNRSESAHAESETLPKLPAADDTNSRRSHSVRQHRFRRSN
jgi:hypothetical protein